MEAHLVRNGRSRRHHAKGPLGRIALVLQALSRDGEAMSEQAPSKERAVALRHLHDKLKSGEYDGTDVMAAWIAVEDLACLLERAGNEPPAGYLLNGTRFKMSFDAHGETFAFAGYEKELYGKWVALVDATDNQHMRATQPRREGFYTLSQISYALNRSLYAKTGNLAIEGIIEDLRTALTKGAAP